VKRTPLTSRQSVDGTDESRARPFTDYETRHCPPLDDYHDYQSLYTAAKYADNDEDDPTAE
jgi:hypothetical protein